MLLQIYKSDKNSKENVDYFCKNSRNYFPSKKVVGFLSFLTDLDQLQMILNFFDPTAESESLRQQLKKRLKWSKTTKF